MMAASLPLVTTGGRPTPPWMRTTSSNGAGGNGGAAHPSYGDNNRNQQDDPSAWCAWANEGCRMWVSMPESFWVYTFKVLRCPYQTTHLWTECPYAHRGERARRRDPSLFCYSPVRCPEYDESKRRLELAGSNAAPTCFRGLRCAYAHGVFEMWLHPARFRTRMCDRGAGCTRKICFFAHFPAQRRNGDDAVPLVPFPPLPPPKTTSFVPRAKRASRQAGTAAARQVDLITQAKQRSLRLLTPGSSSGASARAVASPPSSTFRAAPVVTTNAAVAMAPPVPPAQLLQTSPVDDDEDGMDDVVAIFKDILSMIN